VDGIYRMAASLLSFAHTVFGPGFWPGDWVWATMAAGFIIALIPIAGSLLVAMIRKGTGNGYNPVTIGIFATIGVVTALVLPWLLANGISQVFHAIALNPKITFGIPSAELAQYGNDFGVGVQSELLGKGKNVYETLTRPQDGLVYALNIGRLVVLPGLSLLFVILQARAAVRRGPRWPGRLIWLPFVAFLLFSVSVEANVAFLLWIGFLPASVLGLVPILVIGRPPTSRPPSNAASSNRRRTSRRSSRSRRRTSPSPRRRPTSRSRWCPRCCPGSHRDRSCCPAANSLRSSPIRLARCRSRSVAPHRSHRSPNRRPGR
jgi:hypothetical protein